jgi:hypothetical protein
MRVNREWTVIITPADVDEAWPDHTTVSGTIFRPDELEVDFQQAWNQAEPQVTHITVSGFRRLKNGDTGHTRHGDRLWSVSNHPGWVNRGIAKAWGAVK